MFCQKNLRILLFDFVEVLLQKHNVGNMVGLFPSSLLRLQLSSMEFIHRQHGTLLRLSQSAVTSTGFARYSVQSSQTLKRRSKICVDMTTKHRSSSTNGPSKPPESFPTVDSSLKDKILPMTMWQKFLAPKPMPERYSASWYGEITLICTVFAITGSTTMYVRILGYRKINQQ